MQDKLISLSHRMDLSTIIEQIDPITGIILNKYCRGKQLGKGGFAKCYEICNLNTNQKYAAKIIDKSTLTRSKAKQKLASEIKIHKAIRSKYVVGYEKFFEDQQNVYIVLELCVNQTLNELIKRRKRITEIEAKYYLHQLILAVKDLHEQGIIHRDLKLGNLLLTDKLQIRVADFGLAAKITSINQRRKTTCGTPNYIAPEILDNCNGHSFEVDIWSLGIITYAFLIGRPPFETNDIKTTYNRIKACNYSFPQNIAISCTAKNFIAKMLQRQPKHRATIEQMLNDQFFTIENFPKHLPICTLACPPNNNFLKQYITKLSNVELDDKKHNNNNNKYSIDKSNSSLNGNNNNNNNQRKDILRTDRQIQKNQSNNKILVRTNSIDQVHKNNYIQRAASTAVLMRGQKIIRNQLGIIVNNNNQQQYHQLKQTPFIWVTYYQQNTKFGISYMLNSNCIGMRFNDSTFLISNAQFTRMKYLDNLNSEGEIIQLGISDVQQQQNMSKKMKIISYYQKQLKLKKEEKQRKMSNQQLIQKQRLRFRETAHSTMTNYVIKHCKTSKVNIFWFNTKDYQIVFKDSTQLLISKQNVCYVNKAGIRRFFEKSSLMNQSEQIRKRMDYINKIIQTLKQNRQNNNNNNNNTQQNNNNNNKQNKPQSVQTLIRSSSVYKIDKPKIVMMKACSSTSRLTVRKNGCIKN